MRLEHDTWVVVADGEKYRLLRNAGTAERPKLSVVLTEEIKNPPARELSSDRPGRMKDQGQAKSALQQTDWHRVLSENSIRPGFAS